MRLTPLMHEDVAKVLTGRNDVEPAHDHFALAEGALVRDGARPLDARRDGRRESVLRAGCAELFAT